MVDSWGSGAIMGTTAPEIGHALLQTVAVLTSDAGQSDSKDNFLYLRMDTIIDPLIRSGAMVCSSIQL